jgi:two-component sensor histidine kinase
VIEQLTSAATSRLEQRISKLFALTLLLASIETIANAWQQFQLLSPLGVFVVAVVALNVVLIQISAWQKTVKRIWVRVFAGVSFASMLLWPWSVLDYRALDLEFQPWVWWLIGLGVVAMGVAAKPKFAVLYLVATSGTWLWLDTSDFSGGSEFFASLQDANYIFLFGGTILGLFLIVREAVLDVDIANTAAIQSAVQQARVDAEERERQRIDALVHDKVLNTLLVAAKADSPASQQAAVTLAREAIQSLLAADIEPDSNSTINPLGLFRALRKAAQQIIPQVEVEVASPGSVEIPASVAQALTEALIQALDNVSKHSSATSVMLRLDSPVSNSVLIELRDNGVGFRLDRIPRDRIGVRTSILKRLEAVNARGTILTEPGRGTLVRLEWSE